MYLLLFDCGEFGMFDSLKEAQIDAIEHGYGCGWEIYLLGDPIESSPQP